MRKRKKLNNFAIHKKKGTRISFNKKIKMKMKIDQKENYGIRDSINLVQKRLTVNCTPNLG